MIIRPRRYLNLTDYEVVRRIVDRAVDDAAGPDAAGRTPLVSQLAELAASVAVASNSRISSVLVDASEVRLLTSSDDARAV